MTSLKNFNADTYNLNNIIPSDLYRLINFLLNNPIYNNLYITKLLSYKITSIDLNNYIFIFLLVNALTIILLYLNYDSIIYKKYTECKDLIILLLYNSNNKLKSKKNINIKDDELIENCLIDSDISIDDNKYKIFEKLLDIINNILYNNIEYYIDILKYNFVYNYTNIIKNEISSINSKEIIDKYKIHKLNLINQYIEYIEFKTVQ